MITSRYVITTAGEWLAKDGEGMIDREFREYAIDGILYREYKLDTIVAERVKQLRLGLSGCNINTWRAVAIQVVGIEDQMTGKEICRLAAWTLNEEEEWD